MFNTSLTVVSSFLTIYKIMCSPAIKHSWKTRGATLQPVGPQGDGCYLVIKHSPGIASAADGI